MADRVEDDALILSLAAFATRGSRASSGLALFRRAVDAPDADERLDEASLRLAQRVEAAQEMVSPGLLKMVELLAFL